MKKVYQTSWLFAIIAFLTNTACAQEINVQLGFRDSIKSEILNENRTVLIHLPEAFNPNQSYPVLFRLDGSTELLMETVAITNRLTYADEISPEMIIVAIENTNRARDMWPTNTMYYPEPYVAGAKDFLEFVEKELFPFIEQKYQTTEKIICGQSLSGIFTIYAFLTNPGLFDSYIVSSGAFPGCNDYFTDLYNKSFSDLNQFNGQAIFITNGLQDPLDPDGAFEEEIENFYNSLKTSIGLKVKHRYLTYENEGHTPFHSLYDGLKFIYQSK